MSLLANVSSSTSGIGGVLLAVPQLASLLPGQKSPQNTIGYQPTLQNGSNVNPPALLFQYEGEQSVELKSDITDHWNESNDALQNQIALRPPRVSTKGFICELTDAPANAALAALQIAANKLTIVGGLSPQLSVAAADAYNQAAFKYATAQNAANAAVSAFGSITAGLGGPSGEAVVSNGGITNTSLNLFGFGTQSKQQVMFQQFFGYWNSRTLFTVQTPWAVFQNMAIESVRPVQDAETNMITTFELTFKQMRFAQIGGALTIANVNADPSSRLFSQTAPNVSFAASNLSESVAQPTPPTSLLVA
jgi:hypothetical protein